MPNRLIGSHKKHLMRYLFYICETFIPSNASYLDGYCRAQSAICGPKI